MELSNFKRDASPRQSLREKALVKRRINKEHNSNFRAGYVQINEEQLHKTGIRGRKAYFVYCVAACLGIAAVTNAIMTWLIMGVLRIGHSGMESLEFLPHGELLRFLEDTEIDHVFPVLDTLGSSHEDSLEIWADNDQEVLARIILANKTKAALSVSSEEISVDAKSFTVEDPETGWTVFSTDFENNMPFPEDVNHLKVSQVFTNRVTSGINERLNIESRSTIQLRGTDEVNINSREVIIEGKDEMDISTHGHLTFNASEGIFFEKVSSFDVTSSPRDPSAVSYKLCVCASSGVLYGVPADRKCSNIDLNSNPCS